MRDTLPAKNREKQNQNEHYMFQSCSAMVLKPLTLRVRLNGIFQGKTITGTACQMLLRITYIL
ncbi:hypothetical protein BLA27_01665 [Brucella cytisi]|uniref:Uncharacterized protein n=1 Tax=Brucella cytisi TaxID=407152 RepID=A0A1J6I964_9HYPH|nr:hypothetical protein BLA27_01665 [Brucella cytisi]